MGVMVGSMVYSASQFLGQRLDSSVVLKILRIRTLAMITFTPRSRSKRMPSIERFSDPGSLVMASCTSGRCE